jgi:hypothetical protein
MPLELRRYENPRIDGLTDAGRLRWVLEFSRKDLDALPSEELEAIAVDLRDATAPWLAQKRPCMTMPAAQLRALQQEISQGIQAVLGDLVPSVDAIMMSLGSKPPRGWVLPETPTHLVRVNLDDHGGYIRIWRIGEGTDERTAIVEGIARLMGQFGDRLCTCPVCGTPFLRQYRQAYCTVRCSNKVRNKRRLDRQAHQRERRANTKRHAAAVTATPSR